MNYGRVEAKVKTTLRTKRNPLEQVCEQLGDEGERSEAGQERRRDCKERVGHAQSATRARIRTNPTELKASSRMNQAMRSLYQRVRAGSIEEGIS